MRLRSLFLMLALLVFEVGCATRLPASHYARTDTHTLEDTSNTGLGKAYEQAAKQHPGESGFHLLPTGPEALMMRISLAEASQRSIDMQYFSTRDDTTGKLLLEAVARAADRGVRVRMLLDDWYLDDFEARAVSLNAHPNIEIRVFNPTSTQDEYFFAHMGNVSQLTRRMHNKAVIFDNQVAIMGGRNLGDEFFEASPDIDFQDIDVFTVGPITRQISKNFDTYWNSEESFPLSTLNLPSPDPQTIDALSDDMKAHWQEMLNSPIGKQLSKLQLPRGAKKGDVPLSWAPAELVADSPNKVDQPSDEAVSAPAISLRELLHQAQHEFIAFTPYFVPLDSGVEELSALVARGVAVRIVTNSLASTDMVPAEAGYSHYREALVKGGVELYEVKSTQPNHAVKSMFKPSSQNGLHSKIYMIDRKDLVIGSFNLDPRSVQLNTEQVLVIHSPELCAKIARIFEEVTSPTASYHVILTSKVPPADRPDLMAGTLTWVTRENGKTVYYDFSPQTGFWRKVIDGIFSILPFDTEL